MVKFRVVILLSLLLGLPQPMLLAQSGNAAPTPHEVVEQLSENVLDALESTRSRFDEDPDAFYQAIDAAVGESVDFRRMAYLVMDQKYYASSSAEQRSRFVEVFRESLIETYARGLIGITDASYEIAPPNPADAEKTMVNVEQVLSGGGDTVEVIYSMRKGADGRWLLNNVIIEGINLGRTFRNQFAQLASRYSDDLDQVIANWAPEDVSG